MAHFGILFDEFCKYSHCRTTVTIKVWNTFIPPLPQLHPEPLIAPLEPPLPAASGPQQLIIDLLPNEFHG